jgi:hypothetical protein
MSFVITQPEMLAWVTENLHLRGREQSRGSELVRIQGDVR